MADQLHGPPWWGHRNLKAVCQGFDSPMVHHPNEPSAEELIDFMKRLGLDLQPWQEQFIRTLYASADDLPD